MDPRVFFVVVAVAAAASVVGVGGDFAADKAECADKLVGLATCLPYAQDQAAAPTPDCCAGLKTVLQTSAKCLCVLIKDRDDPGLGFKFNVSKALGLPAVCSAPGNISDCPRLLNLPPNSTDAQIFEQYAKQQGAQGAPSGTAPMLENSGYLPALSLGIEPEVIYVEAMPAIKWENDCIKIPSSGGSSAANTGAQKNAAAPATMKWSGVDGVGGAASAVVLFFSAAVPLAVPFLHVLG